MNLGYLTAINHEVDSTESIECRYFLRLSVKGGMQRGYYDFYKNFQKLNNYCTDFIQLYQTS